MLITNNDELKKYTAPYRIWQGIPSIAITKKGRIFVTFYSGGIKEEIGNYSLLIKSDDGVNFSDPIAVAYKEGFRCYDPCLWIDPLDRLWFTWGFAPNHMVYAVICSNPDDDELIWSDVIELGGEVMMNKPTVLSTGEWLFPIAVWKKEIAAAFYPSNASDRRAFAYKSIDNGQTFEKLGGVDIWNRAFDEHMLLELKDGRIAMFIRTTNGIGVSYSYDRGKTWTEGKDSGLGGPCSRFFISRLKSGRILLINHHNFTGRNNLTAFLSEDEGETWKYKLLLDERSNIAYPDAVEANDGYIYITYDRERGSFKHSLDDVYSDAREILIAKITEEDIINGKITDCGSKLKFVVSKLGKYILEKENPHNEPKRYTDRELLDYLLNQPDIDVVTYLFDHIPINCVNMCELDCKKLDSLINEFKTNTQNKEKLLAEIISLIRSVTTNKKNETPIVNVIKDIILQHLSDDISIPCIAEKIGISMYYMCHLFKRETGLTVVNYKNELRISMAKNMLVSSDKKITDIAQECGFGSDSYFSKVFTDSEKVSPSQYRKMLSKCL